MTADSGANRVRVTHRFRASAERVFDAWLDPGRAGAWLFATPTGRDRRVAIDARVGGSFTFTERRGGEDVEHRGEYLELERPRRIVFMFAAGPAGGPLSPPTRVTVAIAPHGEGCEVTLTHEGVMPEYASRTEGGWSMILGRLEGGLEGGRPAEGAAGGA